MIASEPAVKRAINILYGNEGAAEAMAQMQAETAAAQECASGADGGKRRTGKCDADDPPGQFDY